MLFKIVLYVCNVVLNAFFQLSSSIPWFNDTDKHHPFKAQLRGSELVWLCIHYYEIKYYDVADFHKLLNIH